MIMKSSKKISPQEEENIYYVKKVPENLYNLSSLQVTVIDNEIDPYGGPPIKH